MSQFRGVIFDFNGVLLWDEALQLQSWHRMAMQLREKPLGADEAAVHMHGRTNSHVLSYLAGREIQGDELSTLTQAKESIYRRLCLEHPDTFKHSPGAVSLLDNLAENGVPRTIATASEKTNLDFFVAHPGLATWFQLDKIVYDDAVRPGKPHPATYLAAAKNLGLSPAECIVVEDAVSGVQSAAAAGIGYIVGLDPTCGAPERLMEEGASTIVQSLRDFPLESIVWPYL